MSNIKKILITILMTITAVLGYTAISKAAYDVGDKVRLDYQDYISRSDLYCVEHNQTLHTNEFVTYEVVSKVHIVGNESTDHTGKKIESKYNAQLAYILSSNRSKDTKQKALWYFMPTWMKKVGQYHAGLNVGFVSSANEGSTVLNEEAIEYAKEVENIAELKDNTDKDKLKVTTEGDYLKIGPFNWSFAGELSEIKVKDQDGKNISGVKFARYSGGELKEISISDINSDKNFYVLVPLNKGVTKITEISAKGSVELKGVTIYFLKSRSGNAYQNLISARPNPDDYEYDNTFEYDIELLGRLKIIKVDQDDNEIKLQGVGFKIQRKDSGLYVHQDESGKITYVKESEATEFITDENGEIVIENLLVGTYVAYETQNPNYGYEILSEGVENNVVVDKTKDLVIENKQVLGNLKIIKVDKDDNELKLQGVGFKIQSKDSGLYVHQDENGNITYVEESEATEFITDENGEIFIKDLIVGTYVAYETQNPNYGYEIITEGVENEVIIDQTTDFIIENKQIYVKLSGYVWVDRQSGKQSLRNDLYKDDLNDEADELLEGVIVRLIDRRTGEIAKNDNGEEYQAITKEIDLGDGIIRYYQFVDVRTEELENYYIEFEYDGLTYSNVTPHIDKDNGSKAAENATVRDEFNKDFSSIEGTSQSEGVTLDENGNVAHELKYDINSEEHTATLVNDGLPVGQYPITATTDETGYSIVEHFTPGTEEIPYINLGLFEREQPDLAVMKDMQNVRLAINGYQHVYEYAQRFENLEAQDEEGYENTGFNVGVKFANEYIENKYTRAIYRADYEYQNDEDKDRELKVYITYKIGILNESSSLVSQVNSLVDYFDSRYTIIGAGTGVDQEGKLTGNLQYTTQEAYNTEYQKTIITTNSRIESGKVSEIYVQFELSREAVLEILNEGSTLDNVVEINSYSTFDGNGKVYAGVDVDSNPGNAVPGDITTYEDDTDRSPSLQLEVADAREIAGKVFLDSTSEELLVGQIRQGSGQYEEGELGISGVEVKFTENSGTDLVYTATTDENGDFVIEGFIPGDYTLTYTWGDETYTVQNYKGTVYNKDRYDANMANDKWYKDDVDTRWTDAVDDYDTRLAIDAELSELTNSTETTIDKMDSTTPTLGIGVEYETTYSASWGDRYVYRIENVDFGIVERARQGITLSKRVSSVKLSLANGQTLVDVQITEDGELIGETGTLTYLPPSEASVPSQGMVRIELDSELIQGSNLEVGYEIKATNNSELEYLSEEYYKYGIQEGEIVTITPAGIVDYLDTDWVMNSTGNDSWEIVEKTDSRLDLADEVINSGTIDDRVILYTEALKDNKLKPTESAAVTLNVSTMLTNSQDIELSNETEIVKLEKTGGPGFGPGVTNPEDEDTSTTDQTQPGIPSIPGNYIPGSGPNVELDDGMAPDVIVTPNTGENFNYIVPTAIIITAFVVLGVGIIFIKKKALNKE